MSNERGQTTLLSTIWIALAVSLALGAVWFGARLSAAGHAQGVADAAALAGATGGRQRAVSIAAGNRAELVSYSRHGDVTTVVVVTDGARAESSASVAGPIGEPGTEPGADPIPDDPPRVGG